jgi:hypothetical protein
VPTPELALLLVLFQTTNLDWNIREIVAHNEKV